MPIQSKVIDDKFFPRPSAAQPPQSAYPPPFIWPGVSLASSTAIQQILSDNHERWHVFFNDRGFHNHIAHTVLTLWALGADEAVLHKAYENDSSYQRPQFTSPSSINKENWKDFLGNEKYYQAYLNFFKGEIIESSEHGFSDVFEKYIFSNDANIVSGSTGVKPEMLNRFFAGLIHPMIQTAFGLEFAIPGVVAEGLAQTAVHPVEGPKLLPLSYWSGDQTGGLASRFAGALSLNDKADPSGQKDVHAFTVLAHILADPKVKPIKPESPFAFFGEIHDKLGDAIREHAEGWTIGHDFHSKADELIWTCALIYAVGGSGQPKFNADFFYMHFVTSSIFLHTVLSHLTNPTSKEIFLRGYYHFVLVWYVSRGRPSLDIHAFFSNTDTLYPNIPGTQPVPHEQARPKEGKAAITPNPWLALVQTSLTNPDEHLSKIQRALAEFAIRFGRVAPGGAGLNFKDTELEGAEVVDGTLFVRAAVLTAQRLGWTREGEKPLDGPWDRHGFF